MVARGDLGVEIPIEQVPRAQKRLIRKANAAGRPVITATQMLVSMVTAPRPTRAEATDVANAILDGTDAVMLSEETTIGDHPVLVVETMSRLAADVEADFPHDDWLRRFPCCGSDNLNDAVAMAAVELAADIGAAAIIICTVSGGTARMVIKRRPRPVMVAVTPDVATQRVLTAGWGLHPILMDSPDDDFEAIEAEAIEQARASGLVRRGDSVVLTAGLPFEIRGTTNLIKVAVVS
jgi:pyruvate kinase